MASHACHLSPWLAPVSADKVAADLMGAQAPAPATPEP